MLDRSLSLRVFLMTVVGLMAVVGFGLILWLMILVDREAQVTRWDSLTTRLGDITVRAGAQAARERGLMVSLLGRAQSLSPREMADLSALRDSVDALFREVEKNIEIIIEAEPTHPTAGNLILLREKYVQVLSVRKLADAALADAGGQPAVTAWMNDFTQYIDMLTHIRRESLMVPGLTGLSGSQEKLLLEYTQQAAEYAGRERAIIAAAINAGRPLYNDDLVDLKNYRAHVEESLATLGDLVMHHEGTELQRGMERIRRVFLGEFESTREMIYRASREHQSYPVTSEVWYDTSTRAINEIVGFSHSISQSSLLRVAQIEDGVAVMRTLIVAAGILLACLVTLIAFGFRKRVLQPIEALVEASQAIALGELDTPIKRVRDDEIGELAQAMNQMAKDLSDKQREERIGWARLEAVIDNSSEAILSANEQGMIMLFNKGAEVIFGYEAGDMLGKPLELLMPERFTAGHAAHMQRFAESSDISRHMQGRGTISGRRKDGSEFPAEASISKLRVDGKVIFTVILRDISERRRIEEVQGRLNAILESTIDLVATASPDGRALYMNRAGRVMAGLTEKADISGLQIADFHPESSLAVIMNKGLPRTVRDGFWHGETELLSRDGTRIPVSQLILAHKNANGELEYFSTIMRDLTEQKRSEGKLQSLGRILDNSLNEIYIFDALTLKFIQVNQGAQKNLGYGLNELKQMTPLDIKPRYTRAEFERVLDGVNAAPGQHLAFETIHRRKDGSEYPVEVHLQYSNSELVPVYVAIIQDISERHQAEEVRRHLLAILESTPDLVGTSDTEGHVTFLNSAGRKLLGLGDEQSLEGLQVTRFLAPWSIAQYNHEARQYALRDGSWQGDSMLLVKDGQQVPVSHLILVHKDSRGQPFLSFSMRDISELEQVQEALQARNLDLQSAYSELEHAQSQLLQSEKMASIGQLAAGVAHEINNPVGYIQSNLVTLQQYVANLLQVLILYENAEPALSETHRDLLQHITSFKKEIDSEFLKDDLVNLLSESREGADRIRKIVVDLKEFSHVDRADWQKADLHLGLDSTLNIVHNEIKYKAEVFKEYGELPVVECIPSQLNQVFMNLLVNAAQAIEDRGKITLRTGIEGDGVFVEVCDTGKGMPPDVQKRIFDPFYTTKPVGKGTGLGLSLSFNIIKKHQGRIDVTSTPGQGTVFRVWVPVQHVSAEKETAPEK